MLVETVWGRKRWQPNFHGLTKWIPALADPERSPATRKIAIVAIARQLAVDLWRIFTGETTADKPGLIYLTAPARAPNVTAFCGNRSAVNHCT